MAGLNIYPELSIHKAVKVFGFQDVKAGHAEFDKQFIVKARIFRSQKVRMTPEFCAQMVARKAHSQHICWRMRYEDRTGTVVGRRECSD